MLGPLPCSNGKNREKHSFGTSEQGFSGREHHHGSRKVRVFRHFHAAGRGIPSYSPEQGLKSAEQGFIPNEQAI
jgi:hypothetical protein